jgi:hypothetical protein
MPDLTLIWSLLFWLGQAGVLAGILVVLASYVVFSLSMGIKLVGIGAIEEKVVLSTNEAPPKKATAIDKVWRAAIAESAMYADPLRTFKRGGVFIGRKRTDDGHELLDVLMRCNERFLEMLAHHIRGVTEARLFKARSGPIKKFGLGDVIEHVGWADAKIADINSEVKVADTGINVVKGVRHADVGYKQEGPIYVQAHLRGFGAFLCGFGSALGHDEQANRDDGINESDSENAPIGSTWSLPPLLWGFGLFCVGALLCYFGWSDWFDGNHRRGALLLIVSAGGILTGLVLMFFVAPII